MADFESIIKSHCGEDGSVPADAIAKLAKAISTTVGNEFVDKTRYKAKLDEIDELTSKLQTAEDSVTTAEKWKVKYETVKKDFTDFKAEQTKKDTRSAKETAYRALLKEAGVSEKRIETVLRVSDVDGVELDENGAIKDSEKFSASIKEEWSDFIPATDGTNGQDVNPDRTVRVDLGGPLGGGKPRMTKEEIMNIKDTAQRQRAMAENHELFGI